MTITAQDVITHVSLAFDIPAKDILGDRRLRQFARPRQAAYRLVRDFAGKTYPEIGRVFRRDHTTVLHGCQKVSELVRSSHTFAEKYAIARDSLAKAKRDRQGAAAMGPMFQSVRVPQC